MTRTASEHIHLLVNELVVNLDRIMVDGVLVVNLYVDFRSNGNIEYKLKGTVLLQILLYLSCIGQRIAKHGNLVVNDITIELFTQHLIDNVHLDLHAKLTFNHTYRGLTLAETWDVGLLTIILQGLIYLTLIVILLNGDFQHSIDFVWIFK